VFRSAQTKIRSKRHSVGENKDATYKEGEKEAKRGVGHKSRIKQVDKETV